MQQHCLLQRRVNVIESSLHAATVITVIIIVSAANSTFGKTLDKTSELKTTHSHWMSLSSHHHLYNRLAHPADYSIFSWEWTCLPVGESMLAQEYSATRTVCWPYCGWPMVNVASHKPACCLWQMQLAYGQHLQDTHKDGHQNRGQASGQRDKLKT